MIQTKSQLNNWHKLRANQSPSAKRRASDFYSLSFLMQLDKILLAISRIDLTFSDLKKPFLLNILLIAFVQTCFAQSGRTNEMLENMDMVTEMKVFSVSQNGKSLIYERKISSRNLYLVALVNQATRVIEPPANRKWYMARWAPDSVHVAVISLGYRQERFDLDDMQIAVVSTEDGLFRQLTGGPGVRISPFFSRDGRTIYYFRGNRRDGGATVASRYDLYQVDVDGGPETRLTNEEFYQVLEGDVSPNSNVITFVALGSKRESPSTTVTEHFLYFFQPNDQKLAKQKIGVIEARQPRWAIDEKIYFVGAESREGKYWFGIFATHRDGTTPRKIVEVSPNAISYDLLKNGNLIYLTGRDLSRRDIEIVKIP